MTIKTSVLTLSTFLTTVLASSAVFADQCTITRPTVLTPDTYLAPYRTQESEATALLYNTSATLFKETMNGIVHEIARSTTLNTDKNIATIKLDPSCKWSDGKKITADDFVAEFQRVFDPKNDSPIIGRDAIKNGVAIYENKLPMSALGAKALDETTLQIEFTTTFEELKRILSRLPYTPEPTHKTKDINDYWTDGKQKNVSSGAFVLVSSDDDKFVYERNSHYCGSIEGNIDKLVVLHSKNNTDISELLANNAIDYAGSYLDIRTDDLANHPNINKHYRQLEPELRLDFYLFMNSQSEHLKNSEIRQAIKLAIDQDIFYGSDSPFPQNEQSTSYTAASDIYSPPEYPRDTSSYQSKLERAKTILNDAGYTDSNRLNLKLYTQTNPDALTIMEATHSMLQQLPISAEITKFENVENYFNTILAENTSFDLTAWGVVYGSSETIFPLELLTVPTSFSDDGFNKALALLKAANQATDTSDIQHSANQLETLLAEENYVIPLSNRYLVRFARKDLVITDPKNMSVLNIIDPSCDQ